MSFPTNIHAFEICKSLQDQFGVSSVLIGDEVPERNRNDWGPGPATLPVAVIRPRNTHELAVCMAACHAASIPMVAQGGMTGVCGGARPEEGWVALSLERMSAIEEIDSANATITVEAGALLETVQRAVEDAGHFFALDLGSRGSCTIGGNLSTNAGGNRVIRYGMARDMVLGLEVVLPDGQVVTSLNKMIKNNAGYDLKQLFVGSEGTLGVITRAVMKIYPKPACAMTALCAVRDFESVTKLLGDARQALSSQLTAFEVMWSDYMGFVDMHTNLRMPMVGEYSHYILIEAHGTNDQQDPHRFGEWLEGTLDRGLIADAVVAQSVGETLDLWAFREACSEFLPLMHSVAGYDVGLPVGDTQVFVERCKASLNRALGSDSLFYGHIGDGNLHLLAWMPQPCGDPDIKSAMDAVVYGLVREFGGTVSAEHGIGTSKKAWLSHSRSAAEISLMQLVKQAIDPRNLLNPGKIFDLA